MCGIAGCFQSGWSPDPLFADRVIATMHRRGPDASGRCLDKDIALFHARLSVIDIGGGAQPMISDDGRYTLVYNGEVFHFNDLRENLLAHGDEFHTSCDTEVLLHLLIRHGKDALPMLNGFFAFALYDKAERTIFLARDRFGVKPLFYYHANHTFAFASRMDTLRLFPECPGETDYSALAEYLCFQAVNAPRTILADVHKLEPGAWCLYHCNTGEFEHGIWWNSSDVTASEQLPYDEACARLGRLLRDAVQTRLVADVPVGIFLSGGLDSAIIAALAAEQSATPIDCYSIGFADELYDESALAAETAAFLKQHYPGRVRHHVRTAQPDDFERLALLAKEFGEPYADASMLPCAILSEFVRESATVALSGDGADELFGGYERYHAMELLRKMRYVPQPLLRISANFMDVSAGERTSRGRSRRFLQLAALGDDPVRQYDALMSHSMTELLRYIAPELTSELPRHMSHADSDFLNSFMLKDLHDYLPGDILPKVDVTSMASSLEVRSPFLDYRVAEFAISLPSKYKISGSIRKKILGDTFRDILPPDLPARRKRGFGIPMAEWLRTTWRDKAKSVILDGALAKYPCISRKAVEVILDEHNRNRGDHSYFIFSLLMLGLQ